MCKMSELEEKDQGLNELINDDGVCRAVPATPGMLNIQNQLQPTHNIGSPFSFKSRVPKKKQLNP